MKRTTGFQQIFVLIVFVWANTCFAQSISRQVISPLGNFASNSSAGLFFNAGELSVQTSTAGSYLFTEGFIQPFEDMIISDDSGNEMANEFSVYPNPCVGFVQISTLKTDGPALIELFDSQGKSVEVSVDKISDVTYILNMTSFYNGIYFLKIRSSSDEIPKIIKLIKI